MNYACVTYCNSTPRGRDSRFPNHMGLHERSGRGYQECEKRDAELRIGQPESESVRAGCLVRVLCRVFFAEIF